MQSAETVAQSQEIIYVALGMKSGKPGDVFLHRQISGVSGFGPHSLTQGILRTVVFDMGATTQFLGLHFKKETAGAARKIINFWD
jgi:hypothetical protein